MKIRIDGLVPVMLTPFTPADRIDEDGLARLTDWYVEGGAQTLFAVCQSSEMQRLSLDERVLLARRTLEFARGRLPVIASGHLSEALEDQLAELKAMGETGVDALVLVTNRLDPQNAGFEAFRHALDAIMRVLPADLPLGLYECPAPYRRLLSDDELKLCLDTGRFAVLKDVSCDLPTVARRAAMTAGTPFAIVNANAAIALAAMRAGSRGFGGVFGNFHPDLYAWLYEHRDEDTELVRDLAVFLALAAMAEGMGYPKLAKIWHVWLGTFANAHSRVVDYNPFERHWAAADLLDHIERGTERFRARIADA
ncbi:dihydrodipicolinate synthase family protein [Nitratireductor sp. ZSWI3]|uniref:dihydrodipicolinate synthase family protein n=1 Tax=Nitratireductor sp. ZSWI3 TaxID=2966359 RepID=UPI00214FEC4B|nr:dihydrodipicolinate synthase family protein [Nitratireductor sp. ZSWI3]MCR4266914.1 dihydrodipicolinate synthase family protein [Nitratireductor sp. ZSWI3]